VAHHLLHLGISPAEKAIRTVAVYLALLVLLHLSGKRQLAQLNSFDLVVLLLLSNVVQNAIIGNDNSLSGGLVGALALLGVNYLVVRYLFRHLTTTRSGVAISDDVTDIHATLMHQLGLDSHRLVVPGRQRLAIDHGSPIREIIA